MQLLLDLPVLIPDVRSQPGRAVQAVEAWFNEAAAADRGNAAYHQLATYISIFLIEVSHSARWAQDGTPTDTQFTAIQAECGALLAKGLVR